MRKRRKIPFPGQAGKPMKDSPRLERRSDSVDAFVTALEQARLDTSHTKRSRPSDTLSPIYTPLLQPIIPPSGMLSPLFEIPQQKDLSTSSSGNVQQPEPIRESPAVFVSALYISLVLGSLQHSWWVLGGSLLIGLILTGIMVLSDKRAQPSNRREALRRPIVTLMRLLFALMWGYIGWLVCDSYLPLIVHFLCAFIGFFLGLRGHLMISTAMSPMKSETVQEIKPTQEVRYNAFTAFIESVCISLVFGSLLHSWWILGASLLIGFILTGIIVFSAKNDINALDQRSVNMAWLLFALSWGYAGWFVLDSHIPSIIHFLCAFVGFILGILGCAMTYAIVSTIGEMNREIQAKRETEETEFP